MAVKATARSIGNQIAKIGSKIVPSPNPEKKVISEASNEAIEIMKKSNV